MDIDLSRYPKLSNEQLGHIRHFYNLAFQPDGEWYHMGCQEPAQEFLDAYRFQIATMAYATSLAHYHHQPILQSVYKPLMRQLIHKMLRREVWGYWFNTSLGGIMTNPDLKELRKPWADPVIKENIMYSGHLLLMTSLYTMLFDDDEFEKPESIVFEWNPLFYGFGPERFAYDNQRLQDVILSEMEKNGWVGVCCEPNAVFVVCNQFPIIAMRLRDARNNTNVVEGVLEKYQAAWANKGMVGANGLFVDMILMQQDRVRPAPDIGWTAWAAAFMNPWNSEVVHSSYDKQALGYLTTIDGQTRLQPPAVGNAFRTLVMDDTNKHSPESPETLTLAVKEVKKNPKPFTPIPYTKPTFGYAVQWLSELGKTEELNGLLEYADKHLQPTWEKGGLYYPRNDVPFDEDFNWTHMDPFSGNAAIGYGRLNVLDGQKIMWDKPWTKETLEERPWVDGISLQDGVDCSRGCWDAEIRCIVLTVKTWDGKQKAISPVFKNLPEGRWTVYFDGMAHAEETTSKGGEVAVDLQVGGSESDIVLIQSN